MFLQLKVSLSRPSLNSLVIRSESCGEMVDVVVETFSVEKSILFNEDGQTMRLSGETKPCCKINDPCWHNFTFEGQESERKRKK